MRQFIVSRGLPTLLLLMGIAVILILAGASGLGFAFGLVVAGSAGVLLVSTLLYEVVHLENRRRRREDRLYRAPRPSGF